ncbi:Detected protein of unknown function [Hibiscus syriacus]|uniref:Uncharacterized protein n=1 Tax=Hibiscus syriacus TaxID=106335 RepID=A0A6A2YTJ4_HIBSY|nr:Detected protein of unknown function [Hibiscus syriacus]
MPRPGPRPYVCERRAWHSDRHQPMRAEEILYSKVNSEAEYMDIKTLWVRINDAINTVIRRDDTTETGEFLQPCIEGTQVAENTTQGYLLTSSHCTASYSSFMKHKTMNVAHMCTGVQKHVVQNGDRATDRFSFPSKNGHLPSNAEKHATMEPAEMGAILNIFSSDVDYSNKMNQTDGRNTSNNSHEISCDLSLRLGPLSTPCLNAGNSRPKEIEKSGSTFLEWNKLSHLTPPINKSLSSFPRSNRDAPLSSSSNEWSVEGGHMNVNATTLSKRKTVYGPPVDEQFCLPAKLPCCDLTGRMKRVGS